MKILITWTLVFILNHFAPSSHNCYVHPIVCHKTYMVWSTLMANALLYNVFLLFWAPHFVLHPVPIFMVCAEHQYYRVPINHKLIWNSSMVAGKFHSSLDRTKCSQKQLAKKMHLKPFLVRIIKLYLWVRLFLGLVNKSIPSAILHYPVTYHW